MHGVEQLRAVHPVPGLDEEGEAALVQVGEPVNKFPDFVAYVVRYLKRTCPTLGKARIAQMLARAWSLTTSNVPCIAKFGAAPCRCHDLAVHEVSNGRFS